MENEWEDFMDIEISLRSKADNEIVTINTFYFLKANNKETKNLKKYKVRHAI